MRLANSVTNADRGIIVHFLQKIPRIWCEKLGSEIVNFDIEMILKTCEFCEKWYFKIVNFVKNGIFRLWIFRNVNFVKIEFFEMWIFG